jgi:hypothetical protein
LRPSKLSADDRSKAKSNKMGENIVKGIGNPLDSSTHIPKIRIMAYTRHAGSLQVVPFRARWIILRRMVSSGMLRRVALVRTDVSEELSASFIRVTRIGD